MSRSQWRWQSGRKGMLLAAGAQTTTEREILTHRPRQQFNLGKASRLVGGQRWGHTVPRQNKRSTCYYLRLKFYCQEKRKPVSLLVSSQWVDEGRRITGWPWWTAGAKLSFNWDMMFNCIGLCQSHLTASPVPAVKYPLPRDWVWLSVIRTGGLGRALGDSFL